MSDHPRATLKTKFGMVTAFVTDANHIYVTNNPDSGRNIQDFIVRGVPYHVTAHFYRWQDGSWHLGEEKAQEYQRVYQALYMTRRDKMLEAPSNAARKTVYDELQIVVGAWASQTQNAKTFSFAEHNKLEQDLERANDERKDLMKKVADLDKKIADLKKQLAKLK